jgi:hypothetical protein
MSLAGRVMVFAPLVVFGFSTKPPTMIRLFAELAGHYRCLLERSGHEQARALHLRFENTP